MSISSVQRAAARSAYRSLIRAANVTFNGDLRVRNAFISKMRVEARDGSSIQDPASFEEKVAYGREVAQILRRNVVQGVQADDGSTYQLRFTEETELGSNDTIRQVQPRPSGQNASQGCGGGSGGGGGTVRMVQK